MAGITDLDELLNSLEPVRHPDPHVLVTVREPAPEDLAAATAVIREAEGVTLVLTQPEADRRRLAGAFTGAWITLTVHSSLEAVGMAAAVSAALAGAGIPCNMFAGYHHDHLLVPLDRADDALGALRGLSQRG
ncbi:ACT domain-containing protein [Naasia sp. SYSU D00057]|uniref:ACT domain-containing protein n=1 Tax=Naasia sp. SYSU D00057 TaxID=2817380 RepID=UPI001B312D59|nr:ACT domain-containing protein [Naasia sp. SYSU D00057]